MTSVATIVCAPKAMRLDDQILNAVRGTLIENGAKITKENWLNPYQAIDIFFHTLSAVQAQALLASLLAPMRCDYFCQNIADRPKKLLVTDMDSTILSVECIDEIAAVMGLKEKISAITDAAMRGELEFSASLRERVKLLSGLPQTKLDEVYKNHIHYNDGAKILIATLKKQGIKTYLVSGGFTYFSEKIAKQLGFDAHFANRLEMAAGHLTGHVFEPIIDAIAKRDILLQAQGEMQLNKNQTIAMGDGANDIAMIKTAGLGVAFHAKPKTAKEASAVINHTDLTTLLFYLGIESAAFA